MVHDMHLQTGALGITFTAILAHILLVNVKNMRLQSGLINKYLCASLTSERVISLDVGIQL